jgi:hypothetical protein
MRVFSTGIAIASFEIELVARVPAPRFQAERLVRELPPERETSARVHGGTKARETSVAGIGITEVSPILGLSERTTRVAP